MNLNLPVTMLKGIGEKKKSSVTDHGHLFDS